MKTCANLCHKKPIKLENICRPWGKFQNLLNAGPLIKLYGLGKNPKLINIGSTFIPDYRVTKKLDTEYFCSIKDDLLALKIDFEI